MIQRTVYCDSLRNGEVFKQESLSKSGVRVLARRIHRSYKLLEMKEIDEAQINLWFCPGRILSLKQAE